LSLELENTSGLGLGVRFEELEGLGVALEAVEAVGTLEQELVLAVRLEERKRLIEFAQLQQASNLASKSVGIVWRDLQDCGAERSGIN
jgi:hypothetical protein